MKFRVYFAMAMYEHDMFLVCETFIGAFGYSKIHFHPSGPFKSIETMLKSLHVLLVYPSMELLAKGMSQERDYLAFNYRV